jgi:hypothetical protein
VVVGIGEGAVAGVGDWERVVVGTFVAVNVGVGVSLIWVTASTGFGLMYVKINGTPPRRPAITKKKSRRITQSY